MGKTPDDAVPCFEDALGQLEGAVRRLETGELDLTEALDCFEHGVQQLKHCYRLLEDAERRVELLTGVDAEGNPVTQPFADDELTLEEKRTARSKRRSHAPRRAANRPAAEAAGEVPEGDVDESDGLF